MKNCIYSADNPKAAKAVAYGWLNAIHYMAPHKLSGKNLCVDASPGCIALCLGHHSGQAGRVAHDDADNSTRKSRRDKAIRFMQDRQAYMMDMVRATAAMVKRAAKLGLKLCVRPNGSTDIGWHGVRFDVTDPKLLRLLGLTAPVYRATLLELFPTVQFCDYSKSLQRALAYAAGKLPPNYYVCFSRSETNEADCLRVLAAGGNVAAVFANGKPETYLGYPTIDGDAHDLRFLDPRGVVVALTPKGRKAKRDTSGFVIR
jgi:hypothetical protein